MQALNSKPVCLSLPSAGNAGVHFHTRTFRNALSILSVIKLVHTWKGCFTSHVSCSGSTQPVSSALPRNAFLHWGKARFLLLCCASRSIWLPLALVNHWLGEPEASSLNGHMVTLPLAKQPVPSHFLRKCVLWALNVALLGLKVF